MQQEHSVRMAVKFWDNRRELMLLCLLTCSMVPVVGEANAGAATNQPVIRIMPLGDSITESGKGHPSYRYFLWQRLAADGLRVDFVGSKHSIPDGSHAASDFDGDHEGHSGWRADQILARIPAWASSARPDIVLLHLGHNDLWQGEGVPATLKDLSDILDRVREVNPHVRVFIAQIIPSASISMETTAQLNEGIAELAHAKSTVSSPVTAVDQSSGFHAATMTRDGTHPNDEGERHMADRWYAALRPVLINMEADPADGGRELTTGVADEIDNGRQHIGKGSIR